MEDTEGRILDKSTDIRKELHKIYKISSTKRITTGKEI